MTHVKRIIKVNLLIKSLKALREFRFCLILRVREKIFVEKLLLSEEIVITCGFFEADFLTRILADYGVCLNQAN